MKQYAVGDLVLYRVNRWDHMKRWGIVLTLPYPLMFTSGVADAIDVFTSNGYRAVIRLDRDSIVE